MIYGSNFIATKDQSDEPDCATRIDRRSLSFPAKNKMSRNERGKCCKLIWHLVQKC